MAETYEININDCLVNSEKQVVRLNFGWDDGRGDFGEIDIKSDTVGGFLIDSQFLPLEKTIEVINLALQKIK